MRCTAIVLFASLLLASAPTRTIAQLVSPVDHIQISADSVATWNQGKINIIQSDSPVTIQLDDTQLTADSAVIWIQPVAGALLEHQEAQIALLGHAVIKDTQSARSSDELLVTFRVRGAISLAAAKRNLENLEATATYRRALALRPGGPAPPGPTSGPAENTWLMPPQMPPAPASRPSAGGEKKTVPVSFSADKISFVKTAEQTIAIILSGSVKLIQRRDNDQTLELQSDQAVLFTPLNDLKELGRPGKSSRIEDMITGAYLEGDVRIAVSPAAGSHEAEERLSAHNVFYDFLTDRAILTTAVLHTLEPQTQIPIIIRAGVMRQLSVGEFRGQGVVLTTSSFFTPSYAIGMSKAYIHQVDSGDPNEGRVTYFQGNNATVNVSGVPIFYTPYAAGSFSEHGSLIRNIDVNDSSRFGTTVITEWGLYETLGSNPTPGNDATYNLDYYSQRGPAGGVGGKYSGGFVTDATKEPWNFEGDYTSYFVDDKGQDDLGNGHNLVTPSQEFRGRVFWEHQHLLPDDWQAQITAAYISDPTFMPEWFPDQFNITRPQETALYLKHQHDDETLTFLVSAEPNNFVTTADELQNQFEVQRLPEIGYHRIGESLLDDNLTFYSDNTASALSFHRSDFTLAEQGFAPGISPGLPSLGTTGTISSTVYRGDFRQELDYPFSAGQFRVVPYVMGRYTAYSDSPDGAAQNRLLAGAGVRASTDFWKVDDSASSDLFDIHRLRHVIEPQLNLFTSAETVRQSDVFIYDEHVDAINDITAMQIALDQRWQTKRGGPERWRSVDVFTLDVEANLFLHRPPDSELAPVAFRGLYFESMPEASIPRDSINADATWRISDTMAVLADAQYNLDYTDLATASIGLAVQRDTRLAYFFGLRYIDLLHSTIATVATNYDLTNKYTLAASQSFDFGIDHSVGSSFYLVRHFDRFFAAFGLSYDEVARQSSVSVNFWPEGLANAGNLALNSIFNRQ